MEFLVEWLFYDPSLVGSFITKTLIYLSLWLFEYILFLSIRGFKYIFKLLVINNFLGGFGYILRFWVFIVFSGFKLYFLYL